MFGLSLELVFVHEVLQWEGRHLSRISVSSGLPRLSQPAR